jgi:tetratricopeptide (TPR) repeat protein
MVFIGREKELKDIESILVYCSNEKHGGFINIMGEGGIGKSEILRQLIGNAASKGFKVGDVINLSETTNQTPLLLANKIATVLGTEKFSRFEKALRDHFKAELENKIEMEFQALSVFVQDLLDISREQSVIVALDTFESIEGGRLSEWITDNLIGKTCQSVVVVIAGRKAIPNPTPELLIKLEKFTDVETFLLAEALFKERNEHFELSRSETDQIHEKTDGSPILSTLAIEWLLENGDIDSILSIPTNQFGQELAIRFRFLKNDDENTVITLMSMLDRRFNGEIYDKMVSLDRDRRDQILNSVRRFSFVKYDKDSEVMYLHDEMRRLLRQYGAIPQLLFDESSKQIVENYYMPLLATQGLEQIRQQPVMLDLLYYMLRYSPNEAFEKFKLEFATSIADYEFGYCHSLIQIIRTGEWIYNQNRYIDILEGELLLRQNNPFTAARLFEQLCSTELVISDPELMSRAFEGLGNCLTLGCEIGGDDMSEAIVYLEKALSLAHQAGDKSRSANIMLDMGIAYKVLGNHEQALRYLNNVVADAMEVGDTGLAANATDYLLNLLQLTGKLMEGRTWGLKGLEWRQNLKNGKELVKSYRTLASNYGYAAKTEEDRQTSLEYFRKAIELAIQMNDHFILADLYQDLGWVYFKVFNDIDKALNYAELGLKICDRYGFGKTKGEILALKFDVADFRGDLDTAVPFLNASLELLRKHGGYYHLMHMLSHKILLAKQTGQYDQILFSIDEMESCIKRGALFRIFYGRSLVIWADCAYEEKQYEFAFERYHKAYYNLALAGQHGAWEAWGAYRQHVQERLPQLFEPLEPAQQQKIANNFIRFWTDSGLTGSYPEVVQVCEKYL